MIDFGNYLLKGCYNIQHYAKDGKCEREIKIYHNLEFTITANMSSSKYIFNTKKNTCYIDKK